MAYFFKRKRNRDGKHGESKYWYADFTDHDGITRRMRLLTDKTASKELIHKIERLIALKVAGEMPDPILMKWIEDLSGEMKEQLAGWGILAASHAASGRPLAAHIQSWRQSLRDKERSGRYAAEAPARVKRVVQELGWRWIADISLGSYQNWVAQRRAVDNMGASTANTYSKDLRTFCGWLVKMKLLSQSPLAGVEFLNEKADRRRRRRILPDSDFCRLLAFIAKATVSFGMTGEERMLLYWLAAETGLRWSEIKSLRGTSFTFPEDMVNPTVRILAKDAKNGEDDELPLLPELAARMRSYLANKPPEALVFNMPAERRGARMLKADLESIGIAYVEQGRYFDFHSLRGMCATRLAKAGVPLTLVQRVMRHSDPKLTANLYNHYDMDTKIEALAKLPTLKPIDIQKADADTVPTKADHGDEGKDDDANITLALTLVTPSPTNFLQNVQAM